jgi:nitrogen fixation protein NifU and related proteins
MYNIMELYQDTLLDHYRFPRHKGKLVQPDFTSGQHNPSCGDQVSFEAKLANGLISEIAFDGVGCVISQATSSMLAELVKDKSIGYVIGLKTADILNLISIDLGPTRLKCALLSLYALQEGLQNHLKIIKPYA